MSESSLTGTPSFAARLIRSERWRVALMAAALTSAMIVVFVRRAIGGAVMSVDILFHETVAVLAAGLCYQTVALLMLRRRKRLGGVIPTWQRILSVAVDLSVPGALMLLLQFHSPRGAVAALSAPALLILPLVILLSVLRLRPWFSFWTGIGAAIIHIALVIHANQLAGIDAQYLPLMFSYGIILVIIGAAAAVVSSMMRRYVIEAVEEAMAADRAQHAVAVIQMDLRVARDIQMGLLPAGSPDFAGYDISGMARPAAQAGGDYYDWQLLPDGRLLVALADVTGHGIGPALVMAVCRAYSRAAAPTSGPPEALLGHLNKLIYDDVKGARFITMALALIANDGTVELISAGHGPTLLYRTATNEVESFGGDGLPLGIFASEEYGPRRTLNMNAGDVLVLLTDGFLEHGRDSDTEQFGIERLSDAVRASAGKSSGEIIAAVDRAVATFAAGAAQADDMTAVAIKRLGGVV